MKNKLTIISRFGTVAVLGTFITLTGAILAQNPPPFPTPKPTATPATATETKEEKAGAKKETAKADASLSMRDKDFMRDVAKAGMMEVEWGKLASENGEHADVKKFGKRMVTDHSKANNELMSLAKKKGVTLPSHKAGAKWKSDKDYMDMMVKDHEKVLAELEGEAKEGNDPEAKKWAEKTGKVVEKHLEMAKEIQAKLK